MALVGIHIAAGFAGAPTHRAGGLSLAGKIVWSETLPSAATTASSAPNASDTAGDPVFYITAAADSFVVIGRDPNINTGARHFVKAGVEKPVYASPGDKVAWVAA